MLTHSVDQQNTSDPSADWTDKKTTALKADIAQNGIHKPVILDHDDWEAGGLSDSVTMGNGHHRVQAAKELEDAGKEIYIPVMHVEGDFMGDDAAEHFPGVSPYYRDNPKFRTW